MKLSRKEKFETLAHNIELYLKEKNENIIAITTDYKKFDTQKNTSELIKALGSDKKVLVLSYDEQVVNVDGVDNLVISTSFDNFDEIINKCKEYDIVITICPNINEYNNYLHMLHFVNTVVIFVKQYGSKVKDLEKIKNKLLEKNADIMGLVYQK